MQIRVEYLGREVVCEHCHGKLRAADPQAAQVPHGGAGDLLRRADELLESTRWPTQP
ncbi:MAG TPA: hypothetical protein VL175_09105 [Pirellulales bacterium]|nr:hypothetical protein [Pirellulales bacterium]